MGLIQTAALGALGYVGYRYYKSQQSRSAAATVGGAPAAFAEDEGTGRNFAKVRSAGTQGMRSDPPNWDKTDQAVDESFPASDPPATY